MRFATHREVTPPLLRLWIPLIGLTATVVVGATLGVWMVVSAVGTSTSSQAAAAHGHDDTQPGAHDHDGDGGVPMPGLEPSPPGPPLAATVAGFGVVNAAVLIAALLVGRSRRRPRRPLGARTRTPAARAPAHRRAHRRQPTSPTGTAGSPS